MTGTKIGVTIAAVLIFLSLAASSFVVVDAGYVGVVKRLGAVQPEFLPEGFHFKAPFVDAVQKFDVRLSKAVSDAGASSKDLQMVRTKIAVQYSMNAALMPMTLQRIGTRLVVEKTLIDPAIMESVKAVTAQYTAEQLITKRDEVKNRIQAQIDSFLNETLQEKELIGSLTIANIAITDFNFSTEFNRAIEEKVRAEQEALKAKNEKLKRVTQAEAAAAEKTLAADAMAYEIEVQSKARADAIEREAKALKDNPQLIQLRIAEKWNGVLPRFTGSDAIPLLSIEGMN
ncbi:MAG TPA: prohibitin family protein [Gammaproteobacteria bacterium]|nr:prohibitin family protein [Gammaproteobacteria bacterium]HIK69890.1 prohibitin family protein [Pseudomonadales bacterium]